MMFLHNLKIAWRNLLKYKLQTSISIFSLTVGMVCFALSALWLRYENSYDSWWPDHDDIYMLRYRDIGSNLDDGYSNFMSYPQSEELKKLHPEFTETGRFIPEHKLDFKVSEDANPAVSGVNGLMIANDFQEFFGIKVQEGRKKLDLHEDEIVLTRSLAQHLFPDGKAIGRDVWSSRIHWHVVAIVDDAQEPSSFSYRFLTGMDMDVFNDNAYISTYVFVKVKSGDVERLTKKIEVDTIPTTWTGIEIIAADGTKTTTEIKGYKNQSYKMTPMSDVRETIKELFVQQIVQRSHLQLFVILGVIVICCALFNYFTTLITRIRIRRRELALRYVNGATPRQLLMLIATELLVIQTIAILLSVFLVGLTIDPFKTICCINQPNSFFLGWFLLYAVITVIASMLIAAAIVYITNRKQLGQALDKRTVRPDGVWSYRINIFLQLAVSIVAIFCSLVMMNQVDYLFQSPEMGFTKHNIATMKVVGGPAHGADVAVKAMEKELKAMPEMEEVMTDLSYPIPKGFFNHFVCDEFYDLGFSTVFSDEAYFKFMQMQMIEGQFLHGRNEMCINETAAKLLGDKGKIGASFESQDWGALVITGIVKDLFYMSPTTPPTPLVFIHRDNFKGPLSKYISNITIQWKEGTDADVMEKKVQAIAKKHDAGNNWYMEYHDAEKTYDKYIQSERALCNLLLLVSLVCVLIAVFGIFSIVSLACERRRKEIAIRKIHGAKFRTIMGMFLKEYLYLLLAGAAVAFPVGYYLMHLWLIQYAKQAPIYWWLYPAVILSMALLIFLTIFWQIRKAAYENPADVIKSE